MYSVIRSKTVEAVPTRCPRRFDWVVLARSFSFCAGALDCRSRAKPVPSTFVRLCSRVLQPQARSTSAAPSAAARSGGPSPRSAPRCARSRSARRRTSSATATATAAAAAPPRAVPPRMTAAAAAAAVSVAVSAGRRGRRHRHPRSSSSSSRAPRRPRRPTPTSRRRRRASVVVAARLGFRVSPHAGPAEDSSSPPPLHRLVRFSLSQTRRFSGGCGGWSCHVM